MSRVQFSASALSDYRSELMGVATLGIFVVHSIGWIPWPGLLRQLISYGGIGVFIFAFLSGIGCYFSLEKDRNYFHFYEKRVKRVLIPYTLIALFGYFLEDVIVQKNFLRAVQDFFFFSFFFNGGKGGLWYIGFCIISYACAPILFAGVKKKKISIVIILIEIIAVMLVYQYMYFVYSAYHQTMTALVVFSSGLIYGSNVKKNKDNQLIIPAIIFLCFFTKVMVSVKSDLLNDLLYAALGVACCFCVAWFFMFAYLEKMGKCLRFLGSISLEVYITNHFIQKVLPEVIDRTTGSYFLVLIIGCLISIFVQQSSHRIIAFLEGTKKCI